MRTRSVSIFLITLFLLILPSAGAASDEARIVVMNPRGIQPEIRKLPMAPRQTTLKAETVYIVDVKYPNTKPFVEELHAALKSKYPETVWIVREKADGYMDDDPGLWEEIKEKGAGAIVVIGH